MHSNPKAALGVAGAEEPMCVELEVGFLVQLRPRVGLGFLFRIAKTF